MRRRSFRSVAAVSLVAVAAFPWLAACTSGSSRAEPVPSSSAMSDAQLQLLVNDLVQCIRENGAPGMPDVKVESGKVIEPDENAADETTKQNIDSAVEACQSVMDRIPRSALEDEPPEGNREDSERREPTAEDVPALRKWAECVRQNGVPEWPDPRGDGSFPESTPIMQEGKSPRIVAAFTACAQHYDGQLSFRP